MEQIQKANRAADALSSSHRRVERAEALISGREANVRRSTNYERLYQKHWAFPQRDIKISFLYTSPLESNLAPTTEALFR
jgi:hypothetical protein